MRGARKMTLQLPPSLEDPSKESTLRGGPAFLLLPQAEDCLLRLCSVRDLKLGSMAGRGGTSHVRWTERAGTREMYATKVFNTMHPEHCKVLATELRVLLTVDCPCIVKFYGAWVDDNFINLALEAMRAGSLFDMIYAKGVSCFSCPPGVLRWRNRSARGGGGPQLLQQQQQDQMNERAILAIAFQILWGLEYLHSIGIVHRDVKPSNVLVNTCGSVKLADFGTALFLAEETNDVMGTFRYMPPESDSRQESDVWAAGLVVAEIFVCDVPFKACDSHVELAQLLDESDEDTILEHVLPKQSQAPASITRLVKKCLTFDPQRRPSAAKLLRSDIFSAIGIRTPDEAREVVREWLYHQDDESIDQTSEDWQQRHEWQIWERQQDDLPLKRAATAAAATTLRHDPFKVCGSENSGDAHKFSRDIDSHIYDNDDCNNCGNSSSSGSSSGSSLAASDPCRRRLTGERKQRQHQHKQKLTRKQQQRCRPAPPNPLPQRSREFTPLLSPPSSTSGAAKDFSSCSPAPSSCGPFFPASDSPRQESDATEPPTPPRHADRYRNRNGNGNDLHWGGGAGSASSGSSPGGVWAHQGAGWPSPLSSSSSASPSPVPPQPPICKGTSTAGRWFSSSRRKKGK